MSDLKNIYQYHNNSKHGYYSSAPSPGYMDWDSQPDTFRKYEGAGTISLKKIPLPGSCVFGVPSFCLH